MIIIFIHSNHTSLLEFSLKIDMFKILSFPINRKQIMFITRLINKRINTF